MQRNPQPFTRAAFLRLQKAFISLGDCVKQAYEEKRFRSASLETIAQVNNILAEYQAQGYDLSVRQLFYQMVSRDLLPNTPKEYKRLVNLVSDARLAGLIDWAMIKDRSRETVVNAHWNSPADILAAAANSFAIDKWKGQPYHIEVMVEKQALQGVLQPVCAALDISFTANKGYTSSSAMYESGQELKKIAARGNQIVILYMGDHDPSGLNMTDDVFRRLGMFAETHIEVKRLALNFEQIEILKPPPNTTKEKDTRAAEYKRRYKSSWELDAIEPAALAAMVRKAVIEYRDDDLWGKVVKAELDMRNELQSLADNYSGAAQ